MTTVHATTVFTPLEADVRLYVASCRKHAVNGQHRALICRVLFVDQGSLGQVAGSGLRVAGTTWQRVADSGYRIADDDKGNATIHETTTQ